VRLTYNDRMIDHGHGRELDPAFKAAAVANGRPQLKCGDTRGL